MEVPNQEMVGWSHPDISLEELLVLIKGFVDMLILASGYQSSGLPANWDVENIKKAVQWALFFEDMLRRLQGSEFCEDSVKELDAALRNLTSDSFFPQGLKHMSSTTLSNARDLISKHLLETHPLNDAHLTNLLTAIIEMEIDNISNGDLDGPNMYIDRLTFQMESLNLKRSREGFIKKSRASSQPISSENPDLLNHRVCNLELCTESFDESEEHISVDHSCSVIEELINRQELVSCISSAETGLYIASDIITRNNLIVSENNSSEELQTIFPKKEILNELCPWNHWRSICLSYLLDKRTIRLLSGANMIFSAPRVQWIRILEPLKISIDMHNENLLEIIEILVLGFVSSRWNLLIEYFSSLPCDFIPLSKQYSDLSHLLQGHPENLHLKRECMNSKEKDILEYLMQLLGSQPHILWEVPPVLAAAALPLRSSLFRMYMDDIQRKFSEASCLIRCHGPSQHEKEREDCKVAERIRCLHVFHIQAPHLMVDDCSASTHGS